MNRPNRMELTAELEQQYYCWLTGWIPRTWRDRYAMLLRHLYETPFVVTLLMDENRVSDGLALRNRFATEAGMDTSKRERLYACRPCGVLEVMIAMAVRLEEEYMTRFDDEDRIGPVFRSMISSLGLEGMDWAHYDRAVVDGILNRFLTRGYAEDGLGGLFYIPGTSYDMREMELFQQLMCWVDATKGGTRE